MDNTKIEKSGNDWTAEYRESVASGTAPAYPSETLVRIFKGTYIPGLDRNHTGKKVLDVGAGTGNNLEFFASLGMKLYGTEITAEICEQSRALLRERGLNADIRQGLNTNLPFETDTFDYLVSWNVIHYETNEADIERAIAEYARVLKPGGRFVVSTTGPKHKILEDGKTLGNHLYEIGRDDDFRKGTVFFYFDSENYVRHYFEKSFNNILVGRTHDHIFTETLDWFIATGLKP